MSTSNGAPGASGNKSQRLGLQILIAGTLAAGAVATTTSSLSFQDISELTGVKTNSQNRWLAHFISVPKGSDHAKAEDRLDAVSSRVVVHTKAVQTAEKVEILDADHARSGGPIQSVNRSLKGDRVYEVPKETFQVAKVRQPLKRSKYLLISSIEATESVPTTASLLAKAQSFNVLDVPVVLASAKRVNAALPHTALQQVSKTGRVRLARAQMVQARAAARLMGAIADKVRKQVADIEGGKSKSSTLVSYAPQEKDVASAFAAVLRPALQKKKSNKGRVRIKLGRGDHKWAAKSLPKSSYSKAQRHCLAAGIYFEARGESVSGQKAVAQVILNRVKNPTYPGTICGVVYQNKRKHNRCQFSFACDGIKDRITSPNHWRTAKKLANGAIDGKYWLTSVGSASHYHADYVWPRWRKSMKKMTKIGRHIFYRTYGGGWI